MKKLICLALAVLMVLSLCACGESGNKEEKPALRVGIGRVDVTPDTGVLLVGGGDPNRYANNVLDPIYVTAIAITDAQDNTAIVITQDTLDSATEHSGAARDGISKATGVPYDNIFICATHTHSSVSPASGDPADITWKMTYGKAVVRAAEMAMEDRSEATVASGSTRAEGHVFVRRYYLDDGTVMGAAGNPNQTGIVKHVYDANDTIQIIRFTRAEEGKKDIIMTNLGVHCTFNGATTDLNVSADYPAGIRSYIESEVEDTIVAFFASAAGDQVSDSKIPELANKLKYFEYGEKIGQFVAEALSELKEVQPGDVKVAHQEVTADSYHIAPDRLAAARIHWESFQQNGFAVAQAAALADGFASIYECRGVISRSSLPAVQKIPLGVLAVGDLSFSFSPYEMYGASAAELVSRSPYENTFVITCANGSCGYIPTALGYKLDTYEAYTSRVVPGTGEVLVNTFVDLLTGLKGE